MLAIYTEIEIIITFFSCIGEAGFSGLPGPNGKLFVKKKDK